MHNNVTGDFVIYCTFWKIREYMIQEFLLVQRIQFTAFKPLYLAKKLLLTDHVIHNTLKFILNNSKLIPFI